ncbi:MAG: glutathione S-transferase family protein [Cyanobacteria bacterium P01_E01_bin.6]
MLRLYGGARSRASIIQWYLEEINLVYEFVMVDLQAGEQYQPAFLAINPIGKVPAVVDGDFAIWESGAILLYLAETYGRPSASLRERTIWAQWVLFANATLGPGLFTESLREKEAPRLLTAVSDIVEAAPFFLGEFFSVVDVAVGSYLSYARLMLGLDFADYPAIAAYVGRMESRPAFQKTIGARS